jgi:hypothetical protein
LIVYPSANQTIMINTSARFTQPLPVGIWPQSSYGVWISPDTYLATGSDGRFYRYRSDLMAPELVAIAGVVPGTQVELVPVLS